ncbi:hypothetical protein ACVRWT_04615 [Streptococcus porcinus]|uniref:Uncharacterized protein n=1 Tax=Streptococcus porcinus TaxID=1340 RepID=A0A4V0H3J9_STRPO|nr:hypothetical protein [Streptococcus porcinus]VTT42137.1 Uncharacterised protein [Streptococcus porcinus]VTT43589.1 Uncharacterised protein [Streptococcus porcinus]
MKLELDGINNAGWTFTSARMLQLKYLFEFINTKESTEYFNYKQLQSEVNNYYAELDGSRVRMFFPWLYYYGVLNDYEEIHTYNELFSELGKAFGIFLDIYIEVTSNSNQQYSKEQIAQVNSTFCSFINNFYYNLLNSEKSSIYKLVVKVLQELKYLTKEEFFVLTHSVKNKLDYNWIINTIEEMRLNSDNLEVKINNNQNAWGYIIPFLQQAGIVYNEKNTIYLIEE